MSGSEHRLQETAAELEAIIAAAVEAAELPVTRRSEDPGIVLPCGGDKERLTAKVNADDPPELESLADALTAHLQAEGWELRDTMPTTGPGGDSESRFLLRDGFEAIVDLVRGTTGTGVDLEVLSPCRDLRE